MSSTSIETLVVEYTKTKNEFTEKAKKSLQVAFKEFFDANPEIGQIAWNQYTPYFNDGDPCVFGVNDMYFTLTKDNVDLGDVGYLDEEENVYGVHFPSYRLPTDPVKAHRDAFSAFTKKINTLPDEIFESTFGDHVKVIANREGFDVQEFEHE